MSGWLASVFGGGKKKQQQQQQQQQEQQAKQQPVVQSQSPPSSPSDNKQNHEPVTTKDPSAVIIHNSHDNHNNNTSAAADPLAPVKNIQNQVESCIRLLRVLHTNVLGFRKRSVACSNLDQSLLNLLDTLLIPKVLSDTIKELILDVDENLKACLVFLQAYADNNVGNSSYRSSENITANGTLNLSLEASDQDIIDAKLLEFSRVVHLCQHSLSLRLLQEIELHLVSNEEERNQIKLEKQRRRDNIMNGFELKSNNDDSEESSDEDEQPMNNADRRATLALNKTTIPSLPFPLLSYIQQPNNNYIELARAKEYESLIHAFNKLNANEPRYIFLSGGVGLGVTDYARYVHNKIVDQSWFRCYFEYSRANQLTKNSNPQNNNNNNTNSNNNVNPKSADLHHLRVDSETIMKYFLSPLQLQCFDGLHFIPSPTHIQYTYNHHITNKQCVLLFDNVQPQDIDELLKLLPLEGKCIVILTSRKELKELFKLRKNSIQQIIQPLNNDEIIYNTGKNIIKIHKSINQQYIDSSSLKKLIIHHTYGHLLTMNLLIKQLNYYNPQQLLSILDAQPNKIELSIIKQDKKKNKINIAIERILSHIYTRLNSDQQLIFLQLHVFPSSFDCSAASYITGHNTNIDTQLNELVNCGLLDLQQQSLGFNGGSIIRYKMHERIRELSVRLACTNYNDNWRRNLQLRYIDYYNELLTNINILFSKLYIQNIELTQQARPIITGRNNVTGISNDLLRKRTSNSSFSNILYNGNSVSSNSNNSILTRDDSNRSVLDHNDEINNEIQEYKSNNKKLKYGSLRFALKSGVIPLEEDEEQDTVPKNTNNTSNMQSINEDENYVHTYTAAGRRHTLIKPLNNINNTTNHTIFECLNNLSKQEQQIQLLFIYDIESSNIHSAYRFAYTCSKRNLSAVNLFNPICIHSIRISSSLLLQYYYRYLELNECNSSEWLFGLSNLSEAYKSCGHYIKARKCISELLAVAINNNNIIQSISNIVEAYLSLAAVESAFLDTLKLKRKYAILTGANKKNSKRKTNNNNNNNNNSSSNNNLEFPIILPQFKSIEQQNQLLSHIDKTNNARRVRGLTLRPEWFKQQETLLNNEINDNKHDSANDTNTNNTTTNNKSNEEIERENKLKSDQSAQLLRFQSPSTTLDIHEENNIDVLSEKIQLVQDRIVELYECALAVVESYSNNNNTHNDRIINNLHCLVLLHLSSLYTHKHAYQNAINLFKQCDSLHLINPRLLARSYCGSADIYLRLGQFDDSMKYYQQARDIFKQQIDTENQKKINEKIKLNNLNNKDNKDKDNYNSAEEEPVYSVLDATDILWLGRCLYGLVIVNESLDLYYGAYVCRSSLLSLFQRAPAVDMDWMWKISGCVIGRPGMANNNNPNNNNANGAAKPNPGMQTLTDELMHTNVRAQLEAGIDADDLTQIKTK